MVKKEKWVPVEIRCLRCGKPRMAYRKTRKFCSNLCAKLHAYIPHPKKKGEIRPCSYCGKEQYFVHHKLARKNLYCNREHMLLHMRANAFRKNCVICGKEFFCQPCQIHYRNRQTCSVECRGFLKTREAARKAMENPPTPGAMNRRVRYSKRMQVWRKAVFERDNYTCQMCGVRGNYLQADHIMPFALYPELRFELSNGRTLCKPCHLTTETFGRKRVYFEKAEKAISVEKGSLEVV